MWEAVGGIVAILAAIGGLVTWVFGLREKAEARKREAQKAHADELRISDVATWGAEAIRTAQGLVVALQLQPVQIDQRERRSRILDAAFMTSALVEHGRLFFRNCVIDDFGADKELAYRGYRPRVLDPLVVIHQVACRYLAEGETPDCRLLAVAEDATRQLVSLVQAEVGRSRAASSDTSASGDGANLDYLLRSLPATRVARACPGPTE